MASYILADLSAQVSVRVLFFILFVVMAESEGEGPHIEEEESLDASWIQEFQRIGKSQMSHNHFFIVSKV